MEQATQTTSTTLFHPLETRYFTHAEAVVKLGKTVKNKIPLSGVPEGTRGTVAAVSYAGNLRYELEVQWHLPHRRFGMKLKPLSDWFTRDEYEDFLLEI